MEIQLNADQQRVYDAVMAGKNVFVSGSGGTGKTTLLRYLINDLSKQGKPTTKSILIHIALAMDSFMLHLAGFDPLSPCTSYEKLRQEMLEQIKWYYCFMII